MSARDPRTLPGRTAFARERQLMVSIWVFTALLPASIVASGLIGALGTWPQSDIGVELSVLICVPILAIVACGWVLGETSLKSMRRQRAEVDAGYTTLLKRYDHVDGIDPRTGVVVRPALPRRSPQAIGEQIGSGSERGSIETAHSPFGVAIRTPWVAIGTTLSLIAFVAGVIGITFNPDNASGWLWLLASVGLLGVILFPLLGFGYTPSAFYFAALKREFPGVKVLHGTNTSGDVVGELLPSNAPRLPGARDRVSGYLVFEPDRITFYSRSGTRLVPFLEIPRSRIHSSHIGSVYAGRGVSTSATVLTVTKDDGGTLDITLGFGPSRLESPMKTAIEIDDSASWARDWAAHS